MRIKSHLPPMPIRKDALRWADVLGGVAVLCLLFCLLWGTGPHGLALLLVVAACGGGTVLAIRERSRMDRQIQDRDAQVADLGERLLSLSTIDPQTDVLNQRAVLASLDGELERAFRFHRPCAVILLQLDWIDGGDAVPDAVLREVGQIARRGLRGIDIIGRWEGSQLVAILPEADSDIGFGVAERLRRQFAAHTFSLPGRTCSTCSFGLAVYPYDAMERDRLLHMAESAVRAATYLGRNQVRWVGEVAVSALDEGGTTRSGREYPSLIGTVESLVAMVDIRDGYTAAHAQSVANLTVRIADALGLESSHTHMIALAGRLHDVGKVTIPDSILRKSGPLSDDEWGPVRRHPDVGARIVQRVPSLRALAPVIRGHHERWDGTGYPDGLGGNEIPLGARILTVADAYSAMTVDRHFRPRMAPETALDELYRHSGRQFDPAVVVALDRALSIDSQTAEGRELG